MFLVASYTLELSCAGIVSFSSSVVCASRSTAQRQVVKYLRNPCASQDLFRLHEARTSTEGILLTDNTLSSLTDVALGMQSSALHAVQHVPIPQAPPPDCPSFPCAGRWATLLQLSAEPPMSLEAAEAVALAAVSAAESSAVAEHLRRQQRFEKGGASLSTPLSTSRHILTYRRQALQETTYHVG